MDFSAKLIKLAVDLSQLIMEDSQKEKGDKIIKDLLVLSLKTDRNYGKFEKVFDILDTGFLIVSHIKMIGKENLQIRYDVRPMVRGGLDNFIGRIICVWDFKKKEWKIHFVRFKETTHHEMLDQYLPEIRKVISVKDY